MARWRLTLTLFLFAASLAEADTVITRDSSSWNGRAAVANGIVTLVAAFRTGNVTLRFGANYVRSIDFNSTVYNPGLNPSRLLPKPNGGSFAGTIYLQNRTNEQCKDIKGSAGALTCDGKSAPGAVRIVAGHTP